VVGKCSNFRELFFRGKEAKTTRGGASGLRILWVTVDNRQTRNSKYVMYNN
jgi:hypothetical protein